MKKRDTSLFTDWVLNNRFSVGLINVLLALVIVLVFNKISFILNPVNTFISAILPPLLVAMVQYYLMEAYRYVKPAKISWKRSSRCRGRSPSW